MAKESKPESTETPKTAIERYKGFKSSAQAELERVKIELSKQLQSCADIYGLLKSESVDVWTDPQFAQAVNELGLTVISTDPISTTSSRNVGTGTRKPRVSVSSDDIIKFLGDEEHKQGSIADHFGTTTVTVKRKLDELTKDKKVTSRKDGVSVLWRVKK